jgi:serine/threonine protein kinase
MIERNPTRALRGPVPSPADGLPMNDMPSQFGDRYEILRRLGQGGMGRVYLAQDRTLGRPVALKTPNYEGQNSQEMIERFEAEARSAARLVHPYICTVYDFGHLDGVAYITMEYVDGQPLESFVGKACLSERDAVRIVMKVAEGLYHAHENGVVHRDVKPENIIVDANRNPRIMDFGIACQTGQNPNAGTTRNGVLLGSVAYMAPEHVEGDPKTMGPLVDVYALGVVLYELLTGRLPFDGTLTGLLTQVVSTPPRNPLELRPDLNPELAALCLKMMAKDPLDRPQSMLEVARILNGFLKEDASKNTVEGETSKPRLSTETRPNTPLVTAPLSMEDTQAIAGADTPFSHFADPVPISPAPPKRHPRKTGWTLFNLGTWAAMLAVMMSGVVLLVRHREETATETTAARAEFLTIRTDDPLLPPPGPIDPEPPASDGPEASTVIEEEQNAASASSIIGGTDTPARPQLAGFTDPSLQPVFMHGDWSFDNGELVTPTQEGPGRRIEFGSPKWTDYDFEAEVKVDRQCSLALLFRANAGNDWRLDFCAFGGKDNLDLLAGVNGEYRWKHPSRRWMRNKISMEFGKWYPVKIKARGKTVEVFVDGKKVAQSKHDGLLSGAVGAGVDKKGSGRFRNFRVTSPEGTVLWEGFSTPPESLGSTKALSPLAEALPEMETKGEPSD